MKDTQENANIKGFDRAWNVSIISLKSLINQ